MSNLITLDKRRFLLFVDMMLRDENGVSLATYSELYSTFITIGHVELWQSISRQVEATDDRFYLPIDADPLTDLVTS